MSKGQVISSTRSDMVSVRIASDSGTSDAGTYIGSVWRSNVYASIGSTRLSGVVNHPFGREADVRAY